MTKKLLLFLCLALLLGLGDSFGQSVQVRGTVTDDTDQPIPGVSILAKGTNQGTVTDIDGNYQLSVPGSQTVLVFSFLGFKNHEITVGNQDKIDVKLLSEMSDLGEVVVVGYGTQKKSDLTGAVATIGGRDLANRRTANVSQALQGQVSGVMVTRDNSAPEALLRSEIAIPL